MPDLGKKASIDCHSGFSALRVWLLLSAASILYLFPSSWAVMSLCCL